ncbi:MAG: hypothetical protein Q8914_09190 [Bacteroidota bacterium]|nr:hypothetical protein [Bacteroidota bacterium]
MKKLLTLAVVCMALTATATAQDKGLGLRFSGASEYGAEVSYQQPLQENHRLEADLGFFDWGGIGLTGIYQWVWKLDDLSEGFAWYAGPGAGLRFGDGIGAAIVGQIGIEYTLQDLPLQFSLDARPGIPFGFKDLGYGGAALSIRYKF